MLKTIQKKKKKVSPEALATSAMGAVEQFTKDFAQQEAKQKQIDEKFKNQYILELERHEKSKKQIIKEFAEATSKTNTMGTAEICKHICEVLKSFAGPSWIRECLDDKFKDPVKQEEARGRNASGATTKKGKKSESKKQEPDVATNENETKTEHDDGHGDSDEMWQIEPNAYTLGDLHRYDKNYLQKVIIYLDAEVKRLDAEVQSLRRVKK